jgi:hypothetical protein
MSIENRRQVENTRMKLRELKQFYAKVRQGPADSEHVREPTSRSLKKRMNQFQQAEPGSRRICMVASDERDLLLTGGTAQRGSNPFLW